MELCVCVVLFCKGEFVFLSNITSFIYLRTCNVLFFFSPAHCGRSVGFVSVAVALGSPVVTPHTSRGHCRPAISSGPLGFWKFPGAGQRRPPAGAAALRTRKSFLYIHQYMRPMLRRPPPRGSWAQDPFVSVAACPGVCVSEKAHRGSVCGRHRLRPGSELGRTACLA